MFEKPTIVAVNGSPHTGFGNTSLVIEMLRPILKEEGFELEVINLTGQKVEYCTGCGFCLQKGRCWIDDDHRKITEKLLSADGVILASPVYFAQVTGQMKTFLDRCLAFGHKPRPAWKPGLAISVSSGLGETDTANYLAFLLRTFGAFSVGTLTAIAVQPGQFLGKEAVEARAVDLARDLARAIKEKRRYPATDRDLHFYQFMANLVKSQKDTQMRHDYKHWQENGLYEGFEAYLHQAMAEVPFDTGGRDEWIKGMIEEQKARKKGLTPQVEEQPATSGPSVKSCRELLQKMPLSFNPAAAGSWRGVIQFEVNGNENFAGYLSVADGKCTYQDGNADNPQVRIKTPADIWVKISRGGLNGPKALMDGQYKVEGDVQVLMKLKSFFPG